MWTCFSTDFQYYILSNIFFCSSDLCLWFVPPERYIKRRQIRLRIQISLPLKLKTESNLHRNLKKYSWLDPSFIYRLKLCGKFFCCFREISVKLQLYLDQIVFSSLDMLWFLFRRKSLQKQISKRINSNPRSQ